MDLTLPHSMPLQRPNPVNRAEVDPGALSRALAGDVEAFEVVYRSSVGRVYALVQRLVGTRGESERVERLVQDVFVAAWRGLASYRSDGPFHGWLRGVALNVLRAELRARIRREERVEPAGDALGEHAAPVEREQGQRLDLEDAIATLPGGARTVFVLYDVEGFGHAEIAQRLGVSVGTSKSQLSRARALLREVLR